MPDVLVLYPGPVSFRQTQVAAHRDLLDSAGVRLVLADDYVVDSDRHHFAEAIALPPPERVREGRAILLARAARSRFDAIVAQSEGALPLGSILARELGLPGPRPEAALLSTSKFLCRERLARADVPQPRFALVESGDEVRAFGREHGYPIVLKGVASALGRLVTLVARPRDVDHAVARVRAGLEGSCDIQRLTDFARAARLDLGCDPARRFLVEAFARGAPIETDGIVVRERILTFGVIEQTLSEPPWFYMEGYRLPAHVPPEALATAERVSDAALRALGLTDTGFSIEMRLDAGAASVIEVNGRLGWDEGFGDLFEAALGVQPAFSALQVALGQDVSLPPRRRRPAALAYRSCYVDARVERVPDPREIEAIESAHDVRIGLATHVGDVYRAPPHPDVAPHLAWALAADDESSARALERAQAAVAQLEFGLVPITSARAP